MGELEGGIGWLGQKGRGEALPGETPVTQSEARGRYHSGEDVVEDLLLVPVTQLCPSLWAEASQGLGQEHAAAQIYPDSLLCVAGVVRLHLPATDGAMPFAHKRSSKIFIDINQQFSKVW